MKLTLVKKIDEARGTKSFFFKADDKLTWITGQYIYMTLPYLNYSDERGDTRHFTISASPTEGDLIRITVRIRQESGYKKTLDELPLETRVEGKGPQGTFILNEGVKNNVFIAGGIGITPFRSMIKYNIDKKLGIPMFLIYSNSDSEFIFKKELDQWQKDNNYIKVYYHNSSISGHLDSSKLSSLLTAYSLKHIAVWVVGSPPFVNAMEEVLEELKVSEDNMRSSFAIKTEKFTGY